MGKEGKAYLDQEFLKEVEAGLVMLVSMLGWGLLTVDTNQLELQWLMENRNQVKAEEESMSRHIKIF
jgi:hypothetical protein